MKKINNPGDESFVQKFSSEIYSIKNDLFDREAFDKIKSHSKKLIQTEKEIAEEYDYEQIKEMQQDLYSALYKYTPEKRKEHEMKGSHLLNREMIDSITSAQEYKELRAMTKLDEISSAIGTEYFVEEIKAKLEEMKKHMENMQALADMEAELSDMEGEGEEAQGVGEGEGDEDEGDGKEGSGKSKKKYTLEEAKKKYEEFRKKASDELKEDSERIQKTINRIVAGVKDEVKETSEMISNWGLEKSGGFTKKPYHEKMQLIDRLRNSSKLKKLAELAGRFKRIMAMKQHEKVKQGVEDTHSIKPGRDVHRLIPSELQRLLNPDTETWFMSDFMEGKTLQYELRGKEKKAKGPIIICIDSSGSMHGTPEVWSKAVALALLDLAREQKRDFYCIHFSSGYRQQNLHVNEFLKEDPYNIEEILDLAEYFESGGTEFEPPLDLSRTKIGTDQRYSKADIIFVTDGNSAVRDGWLTEFNNWKADNKVVIYGVLINSGWNTETTMKEFCDEIHYLSDIKSTTDSEQVVFSLFESI